jgi:membrane-associated phospholipid phosphatase
MASDRRLTIAGRGPALTLAAGLAAALTIWVLSAGTLPGERATLIWIHDHSSSFSQSLRVISRATDLLPLGIIAACVLVVLILKHRRADAVLFTAGVAVVWAINPVLKELVGRSRPDLWPLADPASEYSFPSGHAADTAALALALLMLLSVNHRRMAAFLVVVALVVVAWSQLALGRHYPSDILAGWLFAAVWIAVLEGFRSRRRPPG